MAVQQSSSFARRAALGVAAGALALLGGCVVAPADGVYYGDAYSTYSTPTYGYGYGGYGYNSYPYYGSSSLVIQSSPTYVYGGGRPYLPDLFGTCLDSPDDPGASPPAPDRGA